MVGRRLVYEHILSNGEKTKKSFIVQKIKHDERFVGCSIDVYGNGKVQCTIDPDELDRLINTGVCDSVSRKYYFE